jgi:hypothetical protein
MCFLAGVVPLNKWLGDEKNKEFKALITEFETEKPSGLVALLAKTDFNKEEPSDSETLAVFLLLFERAICTSPFLRIIYLVPGNDFSVFGRQNGTGPLMGYSIPLEFIECLY